MKLFVDELYKNFPLYGRSNRTLRLIDFCMSFGKTCHDTVWYTESTFLKLPWQIVFSWVYNHIHVVIMQMICFELRNAEYVTYHNTIIPQLIGCTHEWSSYAASLPAIKVINNITVNIYAISDLYFSIVQQCPIATVTMIFNMIRVCHFSLTIHLVWPDSGIEFFGETINHTSY